MRTMLQAALRIPVLFILLVSIAQVHADEPAPMGGNETAADRGKTILETPIKNLVGPSPNTIGPLSPAAPKALAVEKLEFLEKAIIESSTKRIVELTGTSEQPTLPLTPKQTIESSTKAVIEQTAPEVSQPQVFSADPDPRLLPTFQIPIQDVGKGFIERPLEQLFVLTPNRTPNGGAIINAGGQTQFTPQAPDEVTSEEPEADEQLDRRKKTIEAVVENTIADLPKEVQPDTTKRLVIELPVTEVVANESADDTRESNELFSEEVVSDEKPVDDNPHVEPGLVKWHGSFEEAQVAARESGKPVLLFHLMGQLDQRFT